LIVTLTARKQKNPFQIAKIKKSPYLEMPIRADIRNYSSSSKMDKIGEKSTMISTLLSSHQQRQQKLKEDLKRHE
jgi:hypothetical protein